MHNPNVINISLFIQQNSTYTTVFYWQTVTGRQTDGRTIAYSALSIHVYAVAR